MDTVNQTYFRNTTVILAWASAVLFYYWLAFPAVNTPFVNMGPRGIPVDHTYFLTWWAVFPLLFNGLLPLLMLWVAAQPNSLLRTDVHLLAVVLATIGNVVSFLAILLIGWFWCNTVISGAATGCNAVEYCCAFATSVTSECPSLVPCSGGTPDPLPWFDYWTQHLWLAVAFAILAVFGWAVNYDLRVSGVASAVNTREARVLAALVLMGTSVLFYWFVGFVVPNVKFPHGHLVFDIPPSPGPFTSAYLYSAQWVAVYLLHANFLPIVLLALALIFYRTGLAAAVHLRFTAYIVAVINIGVLLYRRFYKHPFGCLLCCPED